MEYAQEKKRQRRDGMRKGKKDRGASKANAAKEPQREVWALFSREEDLDKIRNAFSDAFGLERAEGGNVVAVGNESCNVEILILHSSMGKDEEKFIREEKNAMCGYYAQIQGCRDDDVKINLCHFIQQAKTFISVSMEAKNPQVDLGDDINAVLGVVYEAMEEVDSVLVIEHGELAVNKDGEVILDKEGHTELDSFFPFVPLENPEILSGCTDRQKTRRNENMKYLFDKKIYVCELPVNEDDEEAAIRSKEEVVRRMLGLLVVSLYAESLANPEEKLSVEEAREFIGKVMKDLSVEKPEDILTPEELAFMRDDNPDERTIVNYSWCYEPLYILEWVLGMTDWSDPVEICDVGLLVRNLHEFTSMEEICGKVEMRSVKEILDKADLIYRMDWAAVDARIHGMAGPAGIDHGVAQERHKALNWVIGFGGADWDDVDTPT